MMFPRMANAILSALIISLLSAQAAFSQPLEKISPEALESLNTQLQSQPRVTVIVALVGAETLPLPNSAANRQQRKAIVLQLQSAFVASLPANCCEDILKYKSIAGLSIDVDQAGLDYILGSALVERVEENTMVGSHAGDDGESYTGAEEASGPASTDAPNFIGAPLVWGLGYAGAGQAVVVIDTGTDTSHSGFGSRVVHEACFSGTLEATLCTNGSVVDGRVQQVGPGAAIAQGCYDGGAVQQNSCAHGTHVAGIIGADYGAVQGVAPSVNLITILAAENPRSLAHADIVASLDYVLSDLLDNHSIAAINMSFGSGLFLPGDLNCSYRNYLATQLISSLSDSGVAMVTASGNDWSPWQLGWPACLNSTVSVGNMASYGGPDGYSLINPSSNASSELDFLAPGTNITNLAPGNSQQALTGTSMSSPMVAGAWALLLSAKPTAYFGEVYAALYESGVQISDQRMEERKIDFPPEYSSLVSASVGKISLDSSSASNWPRRSEAACLSYQDSLRCFDSGFANDELSLPPLNGVSYFNLNGNFLCAIDVAGAHCFILGSLNPYSIPVTLTNPTEIISNGLIGCAIDLGEVKCWKFQFENLTVSDRYNILDIPTGLVNPREMAYKGDEICVITDNGVVCWGQAASPFVTVAGVPSDIQSPAHLTISDGIACVIDHTSSGQQLRCWGNQGGYLDRSISFVEASDLEVIGAGVFVGGGLGSAVCIAADSQINCGGSHLQVAHFPAPLDFNVDNVRSVSLGVSAVCAAGDSVKCLHAYEDQTSISRPRIQVDAAVNVLLADSDSDGLGDADELARGTDRYSGDSDADGISDSDEINLGLDPLDSSDAAQDLDGDGLSNLQEFQLGTDLNITDTDGDGIGDGDEVTYSLDPNDPADAVLDGDSDGLTNLEEIALGTDPTIIDTDGDGLGDGEEYANGLDPVDGADALLDPDSDGLTSLDEILTHLTDPNVADTDVDGIGDGDELTYGFDPLNPADGTEDADTDGTTNAEEIQLGRDPFLNEPAILVAITSILLN